MSVLRSFTRRIGDVWGHGGDDDDYLLEDEEEDDVPAFDPHRDSRSDSRADSRSDSRIEARVTSSAHPSGESLSTRSTASAMPSLSRRSSARGGEKNIHTLRPRGMDEVPLAADYLKTGCAVVVNLEAVEKTVAVRIIDFMSGVCYGLDNQGHAMKLGETIFLFTPGDYEISSDEADYGENRGLIFKDVSPDGRTQAGQTAPQATNQTSMPHATTVSPGGGPRVVVSSSAERRSWER